MSGLRARAVRLWRDPIEPGAYRTITAVALVALGAIVVSGAAVRLTGSGMGCPTWPTCEDGSLVPRGATGANGWIEFVNRTFTGLVSVAVALAVLGARRLRTPRPELVRLAWGLVAGVFAQALLGGLVVVLHVAPVAVAGHYLLSAVLLANAVVLHHRAGEPPGHRRDRATPSLQQRSRALVGLAAAVLVTGTLVTGSGPHSGDDAADRLPFAVVTVARVHSLTVWLFLVVVVLVLRQSSRGDADPAVVGPGRVLAGVIVAQGTLGLSVVAVLVALGVGGLLIVLRVIDLVRGG
ncbi:MAG: COX15/CtaA family protein, partial [Acidimicrobiales bacterium]